MANAAAPARGIAQRLFVFAHEAQQIGWRFYAPLHGQLLAHDQDMGHACHQQQRLKIAQRIVGQLRVEPGQHGMGGDCTHQQHGVAPTGTRHHGSARGTTFARHIEHFDRPQRLGLLRQAPRRTIERATRRVRHDQRQPAPVATHRGLAGG